MLLLTVILSQLKKNCNVIYNPVHYIYITLYLNINFPLLSKVDSNKGTVAVPERSHLLVLGKFLPAKFGHFNASMQTRILH